MRFKNQCQKDCYLVSSGILCYKNREDIEGKISLFWITLKCGSPTPFQKSFCWARLGIAFLIFVIVFVIVDCRGSHVLSVGELVGRLCESVNWCHCHLCYQFDHSSLLSFLRGTCLVSLPPGCGGKPWGCFLPREMGFKGFVRVHWTCARIWVLQNATLSVESVCTA